MAIRVKVVQHSDYLEFLVAGTYKMMEAINRFPHVLNVCRLTGSAKVLIDFSELHGEGGGTEKCLYAFGIEDQYIDYLSSGGHKLHVAYVGLQNPSYEPGGKIAEIGDLPFKRFVNRSKALEWLQVKTT